MITVQDENRKQVQGSLPACYLLLNLMGVVLFWGGHLASKNTQSISQSVIAQVTYCNDTSSLSAWVGFHIKVRVSVLLKHRSPSPPFLSKYSIFQIPPYVECYRVSFLVNTAMLNQASPLLGQVNDLTCSLAHYFYCKVIMLYVKRYNKEAAELETMLIYWLSFSHSLKGTLQDF